ncbi:NUDIX hydrolase [Bradyrhizobium sp. U87765 SZCCT0131]|uniref:NUDIX hydrolase n=1 Tax=unclassified Bradyrhizobium TaxID=2631580 RepID=UPI001BACF66E|nr:MULTISPECIES: NUDIX hydrolase [unclassified Bradyrhizobium]MBR1222215.1 NUDIX hydrolase [Bradyrhizobium sp. U87765 SZCCT0131]MBR1264301.1 NUDIX hydrolase [Bradyrhizobium sp. U87765 SZCCT0134]MBR1307916.1 NUDIX hydrolase [Bradyrhizobium sp. U87765 SZCCT0110]MBR1320551.1 NUDIX hydrolase [Bradyrhizobium sp. U87765 SZCCT0109]MBR1348336.1 NUDIX hydrolase [Bradyrhizobium sp. U87765 SZCCT0048]
MSAEATAPPLTLRRVRHLDLAFEPWDWPFARERAAEIADHFARVQETRAVWNGRVLLLRDPQDDGDTFRARYFEVDYAAFLAWVHWGCPDRDVFNGFGMGALRGSDGGFLLGEMAPHTATAGRIYFPAGTPDPSDIRGDHVDMAYSVTREVEEEVGLTLADYRAADDWTCVRTEQWIAFMRRLDVDMPAAVLQARITAWLATQDRPELSAIHLVSDRAAFRPTMPRFITAFLDAILPRP